LRVKICGVCSGCDAQAAAEAGAFAIGLNFVSGPRQITLSQAEAILRALPPLVTPVALVRLVEGILPSEMLEFLGIHWLSWVQLYGDVTPDGVHRLQRDHFRVITVHRVADPSFADQVQSLLAVYRPSAVLLDAPGGSREGGAGRTFDWEWVRQARQTGVMDDWPPLILAGGLTTRNVAQAVAVAQPWAVDVSSGVERAPGKKDAAKMRAFVRAAGGT